MEEEDVMPVSPVQDGAARGGMILFRNLGDNVPPGWARGVNWQVEYHPGDNGQDRGFPLGLAWVVEAKRSPEWPYDAIVKFVFVVDDERQKGIGTELLKAIRQRWPQALLTGPISKAGEHLLNKFEETPDPLTVFTPEAIERMRAAGHGEEAIRQLVQEYRKLL